jgi:hypothetical protein
MKRRNFDLSQAFRSLPSPGTERIVGRLFWLEDRSRLRMPALPVFVVAHPKLGPLPEQNAR